jgi:hypothetical protein
MSTETSLDKDLRDDMLKLVRYKVLFVRREYEVAFPEEEDLVSDHMDGSSFTAWKIAEFVQNLSLYDPGEPIPPTHTRVPQKWIEKSYAEEYWKDGFLTGIPHEDKKYLRVYYEVLDRYPREKFKYEEQQIRILEQIRDNVKQRYDGGGKGTQASGGAQAGGRSSTGPKANPWDDLQKRLNDNTMRLRYLRFGFQVCSKKLAADVARAYTQYNDYGDFKAPESINAETLQKAFEEGLRRTFSAAGLESFPARYKGINKLYDFNTKQEIPTGEPPWFMTWEKGITNTPDLYVQRVVGSQEKHYSSDPLPPLEQKKVDLALNVYRKDIGITGWLTTWVQFPSEMALISYEIEQGTFLWIGQVLTRDLTVPPNMENLFWMFLEWNAPEENAYFMYGLQFKISFDDCTATVVTSSPVPGQPIGVRKSRFDRVDKAPRPAKGGRA